MLKFLLTRLNVVTDTQQSLDQMQKAIQRVHANPQVHLLRTDYLE
ncbi:hypothetical protein [Acinetobacter sp. ANC 4178]|nr:hypothetical protein [Acinetobacter sp. ANC 4178]